MIGRTMIDPSAYKIDFLTHLIISQTMDVITSAIFDLIKYQVVQCINTGDKTTDSLIIAIILAIIGYIATFKTSLVARWTRWRYETALDGISANHDEHYKDGRFGFLNILESANFIKQCPYAHAIISLTGYDQQVPVSTDLQRQIIDARNQVLSLLGFNTRYAEHNERFKFIEQRSTCEHLFIPWYRHPDGVIYISIAASNMHWTDSVYIHWTHPIKNAFGHLYADNSSVISIHRLQCSKDSSGYNRETSYNLHESVRVIPRDISVFIYHDHAKILDALTRFRDSRMNDHLSFKTINNLQILLYGKPGCGKTLFIKCVLNFLQRQGVLVDISALTGTDLRRIMTSDHILPQYKLPEIAFILEEFDIIPRAIMSREVSMATVKIKTDEGIISRNVADDSVNLSTLLQLFDGAQDVTNRVIIATTNNIDGIDEALLRPGRFDIQLRLDHFSPEQIMEMFLQWYRWEGISPDECMGILREIDNDQTIKPATLAQIIRYNPDPITAANIVVNKIREECST